MEGATAMNISTIIIVLLVLGVLIILISLAAFFLPKMKPLLESRQQFKGFGLELGINTVALLLLFGIALTLPGLYLYTKDYEDQVTALYASIDRIEREWQERFRKLELENESLKDIVEGGKKYDLSAVLQFRPNEAPPFGLIRQLECSYVTWKSGEPVVLKAGDVQPGPSEGSIEVRIRGLDRDDFIVSLTLRNKHNNAEWVYDKPFKPAKPSLELVRK